MKWAKILGKVALFLVGLIPYLAIGYLVIKMWNKYVGYTPDNIHGVRDFIISAYSIDNLLMSLSILGSWVLWWLFCKFIKYLLLVTHYTV